MVGLRLTGHALQFLLICLVPDSDGKDDDPFVLLGLGSSLGLILEVRGLPIRDHFHNAGPGGQGERVQVAAGHVDCVGDVR